MSVTKIKKRDGRVVDFDVGRIKDAIHKAFVAVELENGERAETVTSEVVKRLREEFEGETPSVEDVQDYVVQALERRGYAIYEQEYISNIMVRRGLPSKCEDMSISRDDYLDYIGHAIKIMKERGRYSVLENVETRALSKVIDQLYECE